MLYRPGDILMMLVLLVVALASTADLTADLAGGVPVLHVAQEGLVLFLALAWLVWLVRRNRALKGHIESLRRELQDTLPEPALDEVRMLRQSLSGVIERQFDAWQLTPSEKDVGRLLLKGLTLREIALIRETAEKTVRLQASAVYQKAGLAGRHAFAAWFLEDLL